MSHPRHIHFLGIAGSGCSAVARIALQNGERVSGCDRAPSPFSESLLAQGVPIAFGHDPAHLDGIDRLVIVPALLASNPDDAELRAARERGLEVLTWQQMLGELMAGHHGVSVAGTHAKGTTTAMLALILVAAGRDPVVEVGAQVPEFGGNVRLGRGELFVNEADEYWDNFLHYHPRLAVLTAVEFDHPEYFPDPEAMVRSYTRFIEGMEPPATLIAGCDSPGVRALLAGPLANWPGTVRGFGQGPDADWRVTDIVPADGGQAFTIWRGAEPFGRFNLRAPGQHNAVNALGAVAAAAELGVSAETAAEALARFGGLRRRFEVRPTRLGALLIDDYAHHPTAVAATLAAARSAYPQRRLRAVYQPHMFSRLKTFFAETVEAFGDADEAIITDIYPAREVDRGLVHSRDLVAALREPGPHRPRAVSYQGTLAALGDYLQASLRPDDVVLLMGAGDIYRVTERLLAELDGRT